VRPASVLTCRQRKWSIDRSARHLADLRLRRIAGAVPAPIRLTDQGSRCGPKPGSMVKTLASFASWQVELAPIEPSAASG